MAMVVRPRGQRWMQRRQERRRRLGPGRPSTTSVASLVDAYHEPPVPVANDDRSGPDARPFLRLVR